MYLINFFLKKNISFDVCANVFQEHLLGIAILSLIFVDGCKMKMMILTGTSEPAVLEKWALDQLLIIHYKSQLVIIFL